MIERAVIICSGEQVERHHFAPYPIEQRERLRNEDTLSLPVGTPLEEVERQMIMRTLQKTKNNKTRAAELLGISLKTLHNKLNLYRERGLLHDDDDEPTSDKNNPRELFGWKMYDWANSAFYTTVVGALFSPYLTRLAQTAVARTAWCSIWSRSARHGEVAADVVRLDLGGRPGVSSADTRRSEITLI